MLKYEFQYESNGELVFAYYPEGDTCAPGLVAITPGEEGKGRLIEASKADRHLRYAMHAIKGIDLSRKSGIVAWY